MCENTNLHNNQYGYVMECKKCDHIQMRFGNIALALSHNKFSELAQAVYNYYCDKQHCKCRNQKCIYLQSPAQNMMLVLSVNELEQVNDLLQSALLSLDLNEIFLKPTI